MKAPKNSIQKLPATINGATLESITGIGERRLRQLGEENEIPSAKDGDWPFVETVKAVVAFYRTRGASDKLTEAKLLKLEAETRLLKITEGERSAELVNLEHVVEVATRGLGAMVSCVMGMVDIPIERREEIILKLREAGESISKDSVDESPKLKGGKPSRRAKVGSQSTKPIVRDDEVVSKNEV